MDKIQDYTDVKKAPRPPLCGGGRGTDLTDLGDAGSYFTFTFTVTFLDFEL